MQMRLSTNQIAAFANLHKQNGAMLAIFFLDQSESRKRDHVTEHVQIRKKPEVKFEKQFLMTILFLILHFSKCPSCIRTEMT